MVATAQVPAGGLQHNLDLVVPGSVPGGDTVQEHVVDALLSPTGSIKKLREHKSAPHPSSRAEAAVAAAGAGDSKAGGELLLDEKQPASDDAETAGGDSAGSDSGSLRLASDSNLKRPSSGEKGQGAGAGAVAGAGAGAGAGDSKASGARSPAAKPSSPVKPPASPMRSPQPGAGAGAGVSGMLSPTRADVVDGRRDLFAAALSRGGAGAGSSASQPSEQSAGGAGLGLASSRGGRAPPSGLTLVRA